MCGLAPRTRSRSSCCRPVMSASAMVTAATPTVTPRTEMNELIESDACLRLASRYRRAMCSSKGRSISQFRNASMQGHRNAGMPSVPFFHQGKQYHVADRGTIGEEHDQAIDPDALAGGGRQAVFE